MADRTIDSKVQGNDGEIVQSGRDTSVEEYALEAQSIAPELKIALRPISFFCFAGSTCAFVGAFTAVAYKGVVVEHVYDAIGSSRVADDIVETYNTTSGFTMALVEVLLGLHMEKFMPVFNVYLHNALWFLMKATSRIRLSHGVHALALFLFPVLLMLLLGNSLRGLQAGHSTTGFESIMLADDLKREQPALELLRAAAVAKKSSNASAAVAANVTIPNFQARGVNDIILKNAIREKTTPFTFVTSSPCVQGNDSVFSRGERIIQMSAHDLDSTSVVYGFTPQEWNSEALGQELEPKSSFSIKYSDLFQPGKSIQAPSPTLFPMQTAFEMLFQGQVMIEKAIGDSRNESYPCSDSDYRTDLDETPDGSSESPSSSSSSSSAARRRKQRNRRRRRLAILSTRRSVEDTGNEESSLVDSENSDDEFGNDFDGYIEELDDSLNQWTRENGTRICDGAVSSLIDLFEYASPESQTLENLMYAVTKSLNKSLQGTFDLTATELILENFEISPQIQVHSMRIDAVLTADVEYGLTPERAACFWEEGGCDENLQTNASVYVYSDLANAFCGSHNCAFLDASGAFSLQKEVGMLPYTTNCSDVKYSGDFHGFYPTECNTTQNAAFLYGIGSYIVGDEYGSWDTAHNIGLPYIIAPRRHVRFTFAKLVWTLDDVAKNFDAMCDPKTTQGNCQGLWYQLQPSGRYLFAGQDAIPMPTILRASFNAPIPLVQLNSPSIYVPEWERSVILERLNAKYFNRTFWDPARNESLYGDACSLFMDSYLEQVESNNYFLEQPLQAMYTSAFYYLMANAGVTELNDTSAIVNGTLLTGNATLRTTTQNVDALGNTKLKGDQQLRTIRVLIPKKSFIASFVGLMVLVLVMAVVLIFPTRRLEYFTEDTSKAQEYIAVATEESYPSLVYVKSLVFPSSGEQVPLRDYVVEAMALVHGSTHENLIKLP